MQHEVDQKDQRENISEEEEQAEITEGDDVAADDSLSRRSSSATLLSVLDDKNKAIEVLQRQLHNQKLQLGYYIKNALKPSKIIQLSKTCEPSAIDANLPLTLAISNFYIQTGVKSRLMSLYERMTVIDQQIQSIVSRQECLLREMIEKLIGHTFKSDNNDSLSQVLSSRQQFKMLNDMFHATASLQSELERYRLCCNRLIVIEDERNQLGWYDPPKDADKTFRSLNNVMLTTIVEQVYSMPVEDRVRCNYVMAIEMEKRRLEKQVKTIRCEQQQLQLKLRHLRIVEKGLREAQMNGEYGDDSYGAQLIKMLESVRADAHALLTISKSQKYRYRNDLAKLVTENKALEQEVKKLQNAVCEDTKCEASSVDLNDSESVKDLSEIETQGIQGKDKIIHDLNVMLEELRNENNTLLQTVEDLRNEIRELETAHLQLEDTEALKRELDNYKSQVEDLEAIRTAYSQLVELHPNTEAELAVKEKRIEELEAQQERMLSEAARMKKANSLQESQIKQLLKIIEKFALMKEMEVEDIRKVDVVAQYDTTDLNSNTAEEQNDAESFITCDVDTLNLEAPEKTSPVNQTYNVQQALHETCKYVSQAISAVALNRNLNKNSCGVETSDSLHRLHKNKPRLSTTTFEVHRTDKGGKIETMKAILESSSSIQGIIHLESANNLSLEVKCRRKSKVLSRNDMNPAAVDEYELMKDCSEETIPNICGPHQCYHCYEKKECVKNYSLDENDKIDFIEVRKEETYEFLDETEDDFDVIEYKTAPQGHDFLWGDSSSSSAEILQARSMINSNKTSDTKHQNSLAELEQLQSTEKSQDAMKDEQAFNQLICINKNLKLITSGLDNVLQRPGGKTSVIKTLREIYKSLFSKKQA